MNDKTIVFAAGAENGSFHVYAEKVGTPGQRFWMEGGQIVETWDDGKWVSEDHKPFPTVSATSLFGLLKELDETRLWPWIPDLIPWDVNPAFFDDLSTSFATLCAGNDGRNWVNQRATWESQLTDGERPEKDEL